MTPGEAMAVAERRIAEVREHHAESLDLSELGLEELPESLFEVTWLRELNLGSNPYDEARYRNRIDAQRDRLAALTALQTLMVGGTDLSSLDVVGHLAALRSLDCSFTQLSNLTPLSGLTALQSLNCSDSPVSDLAPLSGLTALQSLDCSYCQVRDLTPLFGLTALQSLNCSYCQVRDLTPLSGLTALQSLNCSYCQVRDLTPLSGLTALQSLDCSRSQVRDLTPLSGLTALQSLNCSRSQVSDLTPLSGLTALQSLNCSRSQVSDLTPLSGLTALRSLDCADSQVSDLTPLSGLTALIRLDASSCRLEDLPKALWGMPSLVQLILFETQVPSIPEGTLSNEWGEDCLASVRAHFADLALEAESLTTVRLLLLGNGRVGKSQIARFLVDEPFEPNADSTHGIRVIGEAPPDSPAARLSLQVWDFGGQDIYHGVHALFLRSPAVLALVWDRDREGRHEHEFGGLTFHDYPLAYWVDLARFHGDRRSPLMMVQSKCDAPGRQAPQLPVAEEALKAFDYWDSKAFGAETRRGGEGLIEAIGDAVDWLRDPSRLGTPQIGAGRLRVMRRLEAMRDADQKLPREQRRNRVLEREAFDVICAEEGGVTSPDRLLELLDANGTLIHHKLFGKRIILDQGWALEAIYAVFDRNGAYQAIRNDNGRFTAAMLQGLIWRNLAEGEQALLLGMMQSCGMCFVHRRFGQGDDRYTEYIAPDLLPDRADVDSVLGARWKEDAPTEPTVFRYGLLHGGLIRTIMAKAGTLAGIDALYWRGGFYVYDAETRSRLLIDQVMSDGEDWSGQIRVRTQDGRATELLAKAVALVEGAQAETGMRPLAVEGPAPRPAAREPEPIRPAQTPIDAVEWYVSYAWGDDRSDEGRRREAVVDQLCESAKAKDLQLLRDKTAMSVGDPISAFMRRIGAADRVFVVLSDKYLRSPHGMFELSEIWRNSRQDEAAFRDRVRIYVLEDVQIFDPKACVDWAIYWKGEHDELDSRSRAHGAAILGEKGHRRLMLMQRFYTQVADILGTIADTVLPTTFEELERYGFERD